MNTTPSQSNSDTSNAEISNAETSHLAPRDVIHPQAPYPKSLLTWRERLAIRLGIKFNTPGWSRKLSVWWGKTFTCRVLYRVTGHRWHHHNATCLDEITKDDTILLVSNHRTFFDMYVGVTSMRYLTNYRLGAPSVFPVRAPFFYDSLSGVMINAVFSGTCMWPPVFRDDRRSQLNPVTVEVMQSLLTQEGVCFGFHPEGRRSKSDDPYTLEPAKRGVGDLIINAPENLKIVPLFISGLSGNVKKEWKLRKKRDVSDHLIQFYWGPPKSPADYSGDSSEIAQMIHAEIQALADQARELEQGTSSAKTEG